MKSAVLQFRSTDLVWFIPTETEPDDSKPTSFKLVYDYETNIKTKRSYLYFYIEIDTYIATLQSRVVFEYKKRNGSSEYIFTLDYILSSLSLAFSKAGQMMREKCGPYAEREGFLPDLSNERLEAMAQRIVNEYHQLRKEEDVYNARAQETMLLECIYDHPYSNVIQLSIIIIDEILYLNPGFNREHNRKEFFDRVPFQKYMTLRQKCYAMEQHALALSIFEGIYFFICLDCALQVIVGDKSEVVSRSLEENQGIDDEIRKLYIQYGSEMIDQLKKALPAVGIKLPDLEEDYNWISRIY